MHVCVYIYTFSNCELLINPIIDIVVAAHYMDNHGNSIANTCFLPNSVDGLLLLA